jgi:hypothetical protein
VDPGRRLVYRFFGLPYQQRRAIVHALGLLEPADADAPEIERFRRCFRRARERGMMAALWAEVEALYPDGETDVNPFRTVQEVQEQAG